MIIRGSEMLSRSTMAPTLTSIASLLPYLCFLSAISLHFMVQPLLDDGPLSSHSVPCPAFKACRAPPALRAWAVSVPSAWEASCLVRCQFLREALKPHRITLANVLQASYFVFAILRIYLILPGFSQKTHVLCPTLPYLNTCLEVYFLIPLPLTPTVLDI